MWPYNEVRNKCALPVGGVPNVRLLVDALADVGVRRVVVVVGPQAGSVRAALLGAPVAVAYVEQPHPSGTADAALAGLREIDDDAFLIVYGDIYMTAASLAAVCEAWNGGQVAAAALVEQLQAPRRPQDWIGAFVEADLLRDELVHRHAGVNVGSAACSHVGEKRAGRTGVADAGVIETADHGQLLPEGRQRLHDWRHLEAGTRGLGRPVLHDHAHRHIHRREAHDGLGGCLADSAEGRHHAVKQRQRERRADTAQHCSATNGFLRDEHYSAPFD